MKIRWFFSLILISLNGFAGATQPAAQLVPEPIINSWGYKTLDVIGESQNIIALKGKELADGKTRKATLSIGKSCFATPEELENYFDQKEAEQTQKPLRKTRELSHQFVVGMCLYYVYTDDYELFDKEQQRVQRSFKHYIDSQKGIQKSAKSP